MDINSLFQTLHSIQIFSNSLSQIVVFCLILLLAPFVSRLVNYVIDVHVHKLVEKTPSKFDDILLMSLYPSISIFIFAIFFYTASLQINQGSYEMFFTKVFNFLIIVPIIYFMIRFFTEIMRNYLSGNSKKVNLNEAAIDILIQLTRIALFGMGLLLLLANLGYNVSTLIAGLGVGGLAFALAAQDVLKNFFAGIALIFDKTFNKGEKVNFQGNSGVIEELRLRSTKVRTYDGSILTIPNSQLSDNIVENVTKVPKVKVTMTIGLTYSTTSQQIKRAKEIIQEAIDAQEDADGESTTIYFDNFGAYSLNIIVYYYAKKLKMRDWDRRVKMKEDVNMYILEQFEKEKLEMAFPTQTIELKK